MDLGSILLILAVMLLCAVFLYAPFQKHKTEEEKWITTSKRQIIEQSRSILLAEHDRLILALRDLDFDHKLGKIPSEEYPYQREKLINAGATVLRQLDELKTKSLEKEPEFDKNIVAASHQITTTDDDLEALIESHRGARQVKSGGFCPKCGNPFHKKDRFCPRCGAQL